MYQQILGTLKAELKKESSESQAHIPQEFRQKVREWTQKVNSLPLFLDKIAQEIPLPQVEVIQELDKILEQIYALRKREFSRIFARDLQILEEQILRRNIQYRKYYQEKISPNEMLKWICQHPELDNSRFYDSIGSLMRSAFYKKLESFESVASTFEYIKANPYSLHVEEINAFFDWYQQKKPFSREVQNIAEEVLQTIKDIFFQIIQEEVEQEKYAFAEKYQFLENVGIDIGEMKILGRGNFATIVELVSQNEVVKLPNDPSDLFSPEEYMNIIREGGHHMDFAKAGSRLRRTKDNPTPNWLRIPRVIQIPQAPPQSPKDMLYLMEKIHGISLKRLAFLNILRLQNKLGPFTDLEIRQFSEFAFEILLNKRHITADEFKVGNDLIPDLFFEALPPESQLGKKFKNIKEILASMRDREKVLHTDLHSDNILIDEETGTLYLIDFGISITPSSQ